MKVLYDHQIFTAQKFGGISRYFNELTSAVQPNISFSKIDPDDVYPYNDNNSKNLFTRSVSAIKRRLPDKYKDVKTHTFPEVLINLFEKANYDLLHPTYYDPYFLEINKKPFVLTVYDMIHEIYKEYFSPTDITTHQKKILCKEATHIIAISEKTKSDLIEIFGIPEEKITCILLASNFDSTIVVKPETLKKEEKFILFTGSRAIYKNFFYPITALANLLKSDPHLYILCSGHPFQVHEMAFFKDYGIENKIHHVFFKNDAELAWAYSNAELFIFPSLYEGFGFPILEAFSCKCPVISSTGGSLPEVAGDGALYFDPKSFSQIQQAASDVLYNEKTKKDLIEKGTKQLVKFSWDKCRVETFEIYKKVFER